MNKRLKLGSLVKFKELIWRNGFPTHIQQIVCVVVGTWSVQKSSTGEFVKTNHFNDDPEKYDAVKAYESSSVMKSGYLLLPEGSFTGFRRAHWGDIENDLIAELKN